ncbi:MAG: HEAT repeat domain-containing protein [Sandaracinaceae bacterium]
MRPGAVAALLPLLASLVTLSLLAPSCARGPATAVTRAVRARDLPAALSAYDAFRAREGSDREILAQVALLLLDQEARGADAARRHAAIVQLTLAGTRGEPALQGLAGLGATAPARLEALAVLARRGRSDARLALRALGDHREPEVLAAATLGMDPALDEGILRELARHPDPTVRQSALRRLATGTGHGAAGAALLEAARGDPDPGARAAAVRGLARLGPAALPVLRERLGDPASRVRLAAVASLARTAGGAEALGSLLVVAPTPAGIEAARWLAQSGDEGVRASAVAALGAALEAPTAALRGQAGVAVVSLPDPAPSLLAAVRRGLTAEPDPQVRLSFARALGPGDPEARAALGRLLQADAAMASVQAATLLAEAGDPRGAVTLRATLAQEDHAAARRVAARALAREAGEPERARRWLTDADPLVRIAAAGGIVAAAARRR